MWYNYSDGDVNLHSSAPKTIPCILLIRMKIFRISAMINKYLLLFVLACITYVSQLALLTMMLNPSNLQKSNVSCADFWNITLSPISHNRSCLWLLSAYLFIHNHSLSVHLHSQQSYSATSLTSYQLKAHGCFQLSTAYSCLAVLFCLLFFPVLFKSKSQETYTNAPQWLLLQPWVW